MIKINLVNVSVNVIPRGHLNIGRNIVIGPEPVKVPVGQPVTPVPR